VKRPLYQRLNIQRCAGRFTKDQKYKDALDLFAKDKKYKDAQAALPKIKSIKMRWTYFAKHKNIKIMTMGNGCAEANVGTC